MKNAKRLGVNGALVPNVDDRVLAEDDVEGFCGERERAGPNLPVGDSIGEVMLPRTIGGNVDQLLCITRR